RTADDVAVLIFTSGTAGDAKAAELTHGGLAWNARALAAGFAMSAEDVQLAAAPLSHVLGLSGVLNASLASGGALAPTGRFEAAVGRSRVAGQRVARGRSRDRGAAAGRRAGRGRGAQPQPHARVSGRRRGDARRHRSRWLAAHGGRRLPRSGSVPVPRGPKEG